MTWYTNLLLALIVTMLALVLAVWAIGEWWQRRKG